jgi:chitodextrinase
VRRKFANLFKQASFKFYLNLALAGAVLGSASLAFALPSNTGLVAHWSFDQSSGTVLTDDSGNGRNGTLSSTPTWTPGRINNSLKFDGTDMVTMGNITQINNVGKLTLATWIKRTAPGSMVLVGKQTSNQDVAIEAWSDGKVYFQMSKGSDTYGTLTLNDTAWHHVTLVFDGALTGNANRLKAYVDGAQKTLTFKGTVQTTTTTNTTAFNIGRMGADYSNGQVDDTWLYARALSQAEVQDLMQINSAPDTTAPTVPANLNANAVSQTQINLSWTASTDNVGVTGYRVFRNGVERTTTAATSFQDTGLTPGTAYSYTVRAYDLVGNQSADSAPASATTQAPDATAPSVTLNAPAGGSTVSGTIAVTATATDNVAVSNVVFTVDGVQPGTIDANAPYGFSLDTTGLNNGSHTIRATATDTSNNIAYNEVTFTVDNQAPPVDVTPPMVALTSPASGSTVSGTTTVSANASDDVAVLSVKFYAGSNQIGSEVTTAPYNASWNTNNVVNGPIQLSAIARDAAGNTTVSVLGVTVNNQVPTGHGYITSVSANGRYFVDQAGAPLLIKGDSPWSMFSDLSPAQVELWAANRETHGFNSAIVSLVGSVANGGPSNNGATYDNILPFNGGNVTSWNEQYWTRMDSYLAILRDHGITAFLYPVDGWNTASGTAFYHKSNADLYAYGRMVATRYASYPNIVWMTGGDYQYYDDLAVAGQFQNMLSGIRSTGDNRLFSIQHTLESISTDVAAFEPLASWNFAYTYSATYQAVLEGYDRAPSSRDPRPVVFGEGNYEGEGAWDGVPTTNETLRRQQLWALTSGSAGEFTGSQDWLFGSGWENRLNTTWITQAQKIRNYFNGLNWQLLVPDEGTPLVTAGRGTRASGGSMDPLRNDYVTAAQTSDRSQAVVYVPTNTGNTNVRTITLNLALLPASYTATWVDPTDATMTQPATINGSGQVTTPGLHSDGTRDWLLVIR